MDAVEIEEASSAGYRESYRWIFEEPFETDKPRRRRRREISIGRRFVDGGRRLVGGSSMYESRYGNITRESGRGWKRG
jgi:hypothetical protein